MYFSYLILYFLFIDKLIGVHCTHGLNRTGYLICRYLIDVEGVRPDDAIELFNRCRGHCLERQNCIEDLQNGPIRKNWNSSVPRSSGFEDSAHLMQPVHNKPVKQGPRYNLHQIQGHSAPRHFHTQTQNLQQSVSRLSANWRTGEAGSIQSNSESLRTPEASGVTLNPRLKAWESGKGWRTLV
ncbi:RNA/RNP complex-1-interacting phosphatase-like isoform X1 [Hylobates moloch]|uniref:RNA/RNP complex-1-interacting phosphatase-like isoform X1 n=1 Tax=Hylobates moloch TaxID=81572 RepID=UPI0013640D1A|nr:RNA/RNP complex-1-interacting phosphatase-like isoform X1 [Hylobates moloch]